MSESKRRESQRYIFGKETKIFDMVFILKNCPIDSKDKVCLHGFIFEIYFF